jgi:hypothetical protein
MVDKDCAWLDVLKSGVRPSSSSEEKHPSEADSHSTSQIPRRYGTRRFITVFTAAHH